MDPNKTSDFPWGSNRPVRAPPPVDVGADWEMAVRRQEIDNIVLQDIAAGRPLRLPSDNRPLEIADPEVIVRRYLRIIFPGFDED